MFKENRLRLLTTSLNQAQSKHGNLYATFEVSARTLESDGSTEAKDALCLLGIFAMFHHSGFPTSVFRDASAGHNHAKIAGYDNTISSISADLANLLPTFLLEGLDSTLRLQAGLYCLETLSFIKQADIDDQDDAKLVTMHPLSHAWAKDRLDQRSQEHAWVMTGSIIALSTKADQYDISYWNFINWELRIRQLQPHISSFFDRRTTCRPRDKWVVEHLQVDFVLGRILRCYQLYENLKCLLFEIFEMLEAEPLKPELVYLLPFYENLAHVLQEVKEPKSSLDLWQRIIRLQEANSPCDDKLLSSKHELADAYEANGAICEAITELEHIVSIRGAIDWANDPRLLAAQHGLGRAYMLIDQYEEAIPLLQQVVQIQQKTLPESAPNRLSAEHNLAHAYTRNGQFEKAITLLVHIVQIRRVILAESSQTRLVSECDLGRVYLKNDQPEKAIEFLEHVVQIQRDTLAESSPNRLSAERLLGRAYVVGKRHHEALQLFENIARIERTTLSPADSSRLETIAWLPDLYVECEQPIKVKDVVLEFQDALGGLAKDDYRWCKYGKWLAKWKDYIDIEEESQALGGYEPYCPSDAWLESTNTEHGKINGPDATSSTNDVKFEREASEGLPYWKQFARRVLKRDKR